MKVERVLARMLMLAQVAVIEATGVAMAVGTAEGVVAMSRESLHSMAQELVDRALVLLAQAWVTAVVDVLVVTEAAVVE